MEIYISIIGLTDSERYRLQESVSTEYNYLIFMEFDVMEFGNLRIKTDNKPELYSAIVAYCYGFIAGLHSNKESK